MLTLLRFVATFSGNSVPTPWALAVLCLKPFDLGKLFAQHRPEKSP